MILSACGTAASSGKYAKALSGLARTFFYAGARVLLVSYWEVGSQSAVKLTTRTFAELEANPTIGRTEAFRISMRELVEKGEPWEAHPSQWAPFVVVGEGGIAGKTIAPSDRAAVPASLPPVNADVKKIVPADAPKEQAAPPVPVAPRPAGGHQRP